VFPDVFFYSTAKKKPGAKATSQEEARRASPWPDAPGFSALSSIFGPISRKLRGLQELKTQRKMRFFSFLSPSNQTNFSKTQTGANVPLNICIFRFLYQFKNFPVHW
jgi:hypothetical protein